MEAQGLVRVREEALILVRAVVVAQVRLGLMELLRQVVTAAQDQPQPFLVFQLHTLVVVAVQLNLVVLGVLGVLEVVEMELQTPQLEDQELQTLVEAVVGVVTHLQMEGQVAQAVQVS